MQKPYNIFLNNKEQRFNNDFAGMQQSFLLSFQKNFARNVNLTGYNNNKRDKKMLSLVKRNKKDP